MRLRCAMAAGSRRYEKASRITGQKKWQFKYFSSPDGGTLSTAGGLVFLPRARDPGGGDSAGWPAVEARRLLQVVIHCIFWEFGRPRVFAGAAEGNDARTRTARPENCLTI
jgi:hypothetical protein